MRSEAVPTDSDSLDNRGKKAYNNGATSANDRGFAGFWGSSGAALTLAPGACSHARLSNLCLRRFRRTWGINKTRVCRRIQPD